MNFDGKVVVLTGGSRGMGKKMAEAYAQRGADVVIASRKLDNCVMVADAIRSNYGVRTLAVECNVSNWNSCDELINSVYAEFGRINNAGLSPLYASLDQVGEDLFDKIIGVNLKGPFRLSAVTGTRMTEDGGGVILNISSMEAIRPSPDSLPYAAAKAGLNTLTEGMAKAFGPHVRVNAIQCGPFLTDIAAAWDPELRDAFASTLALRRCGNPNEIIGAALYLTGDQSSFCTGAILRLDGGVP